jgi:hypothetical protein
MSYLNGDSPASHAELSPSSSSRWRQEVATNLLPFGRAGVRLGVERLVRALGRSLEIADHMINLRDVVSMTCGDVLIAVEI